MRILFAGNPAIAVPALRTIGRLERESGLCELAGVLTGPDAARGRGLETAPSEVSRAACGLPAEQFKYVRVNAEARERIAALKADLLVCFAYGSMFPQDFLSLFPLGGINIHPSLLPRHRGPSPIQAAILSGDTETGITIQRIAAAMDAGDILAQQRFPLRGDETAGSLEADVAEKSGPLLEDVIRRMAAGTLRACAQDSSAATYCAKLTHTNARIDWRKDAAAIDALVRALSPSLLCWTEDAGRILNILKGTPYNACGEKAEGSGGAAREAPGTVIGADRKAGILVRCGGGTVYAASVLQYQTKKALDFHAFLNGNRAVIGRRLGA